MAVLMASLVLAMPPLHVIETTPLRSTVDGRIAVVRPYKAKLLRIARCESGRRWHIATGNGFYGGLQFALRSWQSVGGRGYPHWHRPREQMFRAVKLMRIQGWGAWPVCQYA